jgi:hypothetical protein
MILPIGAQTGPLMLVLQPAYRRRNHTGAGLDTAVISVHGAVDGGSLAVGIVKEQTDIDELKNQWGWGGFTTHDLGRCRLAARLVALFYN